jgi:hypothetical protein
MRQCVVLIVLGLILASAVPNASARDKAVDASGQTPVPSRAVAELAGKFRWGMSPSDVIKVMTSTVHDKYVELIKSEQEVYKQDDLRRQEREELEKIQASLVKFDGHKTGWESSIVEQEFAHQNGESMIVMWEKEQRRFLFFYRGKLYKQFIAFNAEHKAFAGKSFEDFAQVIQNRYGQAEMKFSKLRTKEDMTLDHLEWPPQGDYQLFAIDQSGFYGNFCLRLMKPSVAAALDRQHHDNVERAHLMNSALIDSVTKPDETSVDKNADIVDQIVRKKPQGVPRPGP